MNISILDRNYNKKQTKTKTIYSNKSNKIVIDFKNNVVECGKLTFEELYSIHRILYRQSHINTCKKYYQKHQEKLRVYARNRYKEKIIGDIKMYNPKEIYCEMCGDHISSRIDKTHYPYKKVIKTPNEEKKTKTIYFCSNKCFNKYNAFNK